jgi:uncharacterized protein (TIGR03086 family)
VDPVVALLAALDALQVRVAALTPEDLDSPSRCPGWSVRAALGHSPTVIVKFTEFASGATDRPVTPSDALAGVDPATATAVVIATAVEAWPSVDRTQVRHPPFGTIDAVGAAGVNLVDVLAHGWDLGTGEGPVFRCGTRCGKQGWRTRSI